MTKSTGTCGLTFEGSPPNSIMASLRAAMSTNAGTPVKSCSITLLGLNGISSATMSGVQAAIFRTSSSVINEPSHFLRAASSNIRMVKGSESNWQIPLSCKAFRLANFAIEPSAFSNSENA